MHLKEITETLHDVRSRLSCELVILECNSKAAEQMERLYEIWVDLDATTNDLVTLIRRSENPSCPPKL